MEFINNIRVDFVNNVEIDEAIRHALEKEYKKLPEYELTDQLQENDEYAPTLVSVFIPFNCYHLIVTIQFTDGMFDLELSGTVTGQSEISEQIAVCNLWFLGNNKIHYQVLDTFWGKDDEGDPAPIGNLFITEKMISQIIELLLSHYFGGNRCMYNCNPDCAEDNQLEI